jgi:hypothetical protein
MAGALGRPDRQRLSWQEMYLLSSTSAHEDALAMQRKQRILSDWPAASQCLHTQRLATSGGPEVTQYVAVTKKPVPACRPCLPAWQTGWLTA